MRLHLSKKLLYTSSELGKTELHQLELGSHFKYVSKTIWSGYFVLVLKNVGRVSAA